MRTLRKTRYGPVPRKDHRAIAILLVMVGLAANTAMAVEYWVEDRSCCHDPTPCVGDGSDVNPFCGIQEAIDAGRLSNPVTTPIEVWVKPGTYTAPYDNVKFYSHGVQLKSNGRSQQSGRHAEDQDQRLGCNKPR